MANRAVLPKTCLFVQSRTCQIIELHYQHVERSLGKKITVFILPSASLLFDLILPRKLLNIAARCTFPRSLLASIYFCCFLQREVKRPVEIFRSIVRQKILENERDEVKLALVQCTDCTAIVVSGIFTDFSEQIALVQANNICRKKA